MFTQTGNGKYLTFAFCLLSYLGNNVKIFAFVMNNKFLLLFCLINLRFRRDITKIRAKSMMTLKCVYAVGRKNTILG